MKRDCEHCKYFSKRGEHKFSAAIRECFNNPDEVLVFGHCHRFPPKSNYEVSGPVIGVDWLEVNGDDWCGEFSAEPKINF